MKLTKIPLHNFKIGNNQPMTLIAGPCVIEEEGMIMETARELKRITRRKNIPFIFKSSYDKANRLSRKSYRGPGLEKGLAILEKVKNQLDIPVITDVHNCTEIPAASAIADILQIPAFLCRQTDLVIEAARTGKIVNIKKGQFVSPEDMKPISDKARATGNKKIMLTERGTFFGYNNLVVDIRSMGTMKKTGYPVFFDATHSVQLPGKNRSHSSGEIWNSLPLAKAALIQGIAGIYLEVHPQPSRAKSDPQNQLDLKDLSKFLDAVLRVDRLAKEK